MARIENSGREEETTAKMHFLTTSGFSG